jgi:crotonobetainyl-CoA:carnitine CoA-transferase CaiB-like acyl-CoA transferase
MSFSTENILAPYRVLDLTDEKGIYCGRMLGDMGADVIKIEKPGGDDARNIEPFYHNELHPEKSLFWFFNCMNKRSITLNIETAEGKEIFNKLVQKADFVIESFKPGYMASLGLGYEDLEEENPRIIMASITPFGQNGPDSNYKMSDLTTWAMSGEMYLCGDADRSPVQPTVPQAFLMASATAAVGALTAHFHREMTGEGQHVDVSAQEALTYALTEAPAYWELLKVDLMRSGSGRDFALPKGRVRFQYVYPCKDGYVFYLAPGANVMHSANKAWTRWIENEGGSVDHLKRFGWPEIDLMELTPEDLLEMNATLGNFMKKYTKAELYENAFKRDIPMISVNTPKDLLGNEQLQDRKFFIEIEHEDLDAFLTYPGPWAKLTGANWPEWRVAPHVGEHNDDIYKNEIGLSETQMAALTKTGVI